MSDIHLAQRTEVMGPRVQPLPEGFHSFDDVAYNVWQQHVARGAAPYAWQTYIVVASDLNFNDNGRVKDLEGNEAPWVSPETIRDVIRDMMLRNRGENAGADAGDADLHEPPRQIRRRHSQ